MKQYTDLVLPRDSSVLFRYGKLQRIPKNKNGKPLQGFEDAEEDDLVNKFDLENADMSSVNIMSNLLSDTQSFNQDISGWD